jgi:hypothetical protein
MRINMLCVFSLLAFSAFALFAQEPAKPKISEITVLPSELIQRSGNCKSSTAGYLEKSRQASMSDKDIGGFVSKSLHDGYIVTVYPATKNGIFVNMECTNATTSATP